MTAYSHSGRTVADVTVEAACHGDLVLDDIRISRETLLKQADNAERTGSAQLAMNLRRAA
ncbi:MAG: propanediol dehydratase small subunit, partial [Mycobacterium sp.]|nr:propanediol dehydratase small subunit [Mycobacterium sp.]